MLQAKKAAYLTGEEDLAPFGFQVAATRFTSGRTAFKQLLTVISAAAQRHHQDAFRNLRHGDWCQVSPDSPVFILEGCDAKQTELVVWIV